LGKQSGGGLIQKEDNNSTPNIKESNKQEKKKKVRGRNLTRPDQKGGMKGTKVAIRECSGGKTADGGKWGGGAKKGGVGEGWVTEEGLGKRMSEIILKSNG